MKSRFTDRFHVQNYLRHANDVSAEVNQTDSLTMYISIYLAISVLISVEGTLRYLWVFIGSMKASRLMFERLTFAVLRAPLRWLDTMPVGRVLNRFTADFNTFDANQAYGLSFLLFNVLLVMGIVVAG